MQGLKKIIQNTLEKYFMLFTNPFLPIMGQFALERMIQIAEDSGAGMVYADYHEVKKAQERYTLSTIIRLVASAMILISGLYL